MNAMVKLKVEITEKSEAEFDVIVTEQDGKFVAAVNELSLRAEGVSAKKALQGLVRLIQGMGDKPVPSPQLQF